MGGLGVWKPPGRLGQDAALKGGSIRGSRWRIGPGINPHIVHSTQGPTIEGALWVTRHRSDLSGEFGDEGGEEVRCGGAGGGELGLQLVDQGHQLIHFGDDTALFGEGGDWNLTVPNLSHVD